MQQARERFRGRENGVELSVRSGGTLDDSFDQPRVSIHPELGEGIAQLDVAYPMGIPPMPIRSAGLDYEPVSDAMPGDEERALDRQVVRAETCLAMPEEPVVRAGVARIACPLLDNALKNEWFIAAIAVAGPVPNLNSG
jgi:hypothetical protein